MSHHDADGAPVAQVLREHWSVAEHFDAEWDQRAALASQFISGADRWFCDLGCGPHPGIKRFLPEGSVYMGADMKKWSEETLLCDLNALDLPETALIAADVCFVFGVLEYLFDVEAVLKALSNCCETLIFSYCSTDLSDERWHLWVNSFSGAQLGSMLGLAGFYIDRQMSHEPGQYVFRAKNRFFTRGAERAEARRLIRA